MAKFFLRPILDCWPLSLVVTRILPYLLFFLQSVIRNYAIFLFIPQCGALFLGYFITGRGSSYGLPRHHALSGRYIALPPICDSLLSLSSTTTHCRGRAPLLLPLLFRSRFYMVSILPGISSQSRFKPSHELSEELPLVHTCSSPRAAPSASSH